MKKHLCFRSVLAMLLVFLLTCTALAETSLGNFKPVREYEGCFTDVDDSAWYAERVKQAYSYGLINGMTPDTFAPDGNLTVAECITL
ncbi:MAG: S-layer homology domain-containing protein, partial [Firmicutes bacterium]|nr:S-layer homology domain-containing protein [Bacillota bacterium]